MATIETIVRSINRELTPLFDERLRAALAEQERDWLIDQIVRLTLDRHSLEEIDRRSAGADVFQRYVPQPRRRRRRQEQCEVEAQLVPLAIDGDTA